MKIAILGYGKEGKSVEQYFKNHDNTTVCDIYNDFTYDQIKQVNYSSYDIIFRSPSVPPLHLANESSITKYFFDHCPCPIIGVTATKGKGTTCSFIKSLLDAEGKKAFLVGNIGTPALDILDQLAWDSVVVYELSSFQLWDLHKSPHIAVIGHLEPDHLNVHKDFNDYLAAKSNIASHQSEHDYLIFYSKNPETVKLASLSTARQIPYPFPIPDDIKAAITLPGEHNLENAVAAIAATSCTLNISPDEYLREHKTSIIKGLESFHGLPHRLEFLREHHHVKYYDDNFSTNPSSTRVAINAFPDDKLVLIVGGRDKTDNADLPELYNILKSPNIAKIILIGESGHALADKYHDVRFRVANSLSAAVTAAKLEAEAISDKTHPAIVLMSPAAASFDMFENVYDRGDQYKQLIEAL